MSRPGFPLLLDYHAPEFPELVRDALRQIGRGEQRNLADPLTLKLERDNARRLHRLLACSLLGSSLLVVATLLGTLAPQHGIWPPAIIGAAGLFTFSIGWPRSS